MKTARLYFYLTALCLLLLGNLQQVHAQVPGSSPCNPVLIGELTPGMPINFNDSNAGFGNEPDLAADCGGGLNVKWYAFRLPPGFTNAVVELQPMGFGFFEISLFDSTACFGGPAASFISGADDCATLPGQPVIVDPTAVCLPIGGRIFLKVSGAEGNYNLFLESFFPDCADGCENGFETGVDINNPDVNVSSPDTSICFGEDLFLQVADPGQYTTIDWLGIGMSPGIVVNEPGIYEVNTIDIFGCPGSTVIEVRFSEDCIWPGDTDADGRVDAKDILPIGLVYGASGPPRISSADPFDWIGQKADEWLFNLPGIYSSLNANNADADGSGLVDNGDVLILQLNYDSIRPPASFSPRLIEPAYRAMAGDPPLFIGFESDSFEVGDTITGKVFLGTDSLEVFDLYGLSFDLNLPTAFLDSSYFEYSFADNWLNDDGNVDSTVIYSPQTGTADVGFTRTDQIARTGSGPIMTFNVIVEDNLDGRVEKTRMLPFIFGDELALDPGGDSVLINPIFDTVLVSQFCDSEGLSTATAYIDGIKVGSSISLSNDNGGYLFFTVPSGKFLEAGRTLNIGGKPGFPGASTTMHWRYWLDVNLDGDFDDPGELLIEHIGSGIFTQNVTIPDTATLGWTTLRVQMKVFDGIAPEACEHIDSGEVEDYFVEIRNEIPRLQAMDDTDSQLLVYPNPNQGRFVFELPDLTNEPVELIQVLDLQGRIIYSVRNLELKDRYRLNLTAMAPGTYQLVVQTDASRYCGKMVIMP